LDMDRQESRKSPRRPLRYAASLTVGTDAQPIPCVIWDISDGGARLAAARHHELPERFILILAEQGIERRCEIIWRNQRFVGVRFLQ
jgi:hypothetical protein